MKTITYLSSSLVLLLASGVVSAAEASIDFYGKFDLSLQNSSVYDPATSDTAYSQSNGSRTGLKLHKYFSDDLRVFIQLESAVDFNTDNSTDIHFTNRNSYIGIGGDWGSVLVGQNDSPLKMSQGNIDLFTDSDSQIWSLQRGENRVSDVLQFNSADIGHFKISMAVIKNPSKAQNNYGFSSALKYEFNGLYTAIAIDTDVLNYSVLRWVGSYSFDAYTISALVEESESNITSENNRGYTLSSSYEFRGYLLKLQYTNSDEIIRGGKFMTAGIDWRFSDSTVIYTFYTNRASDEKEGDLLSLGIKYKF